MENLTFFPSEGSLPWCSFHKISPITFWKTKKRNTELSSKIIKQFEKEKRDFRLKREMDFKNLDKSKYNFSEKEYLDFLDNENFDLSRCLIENKINRDRELFEEYILNKSIIENDNRELKNYLDKSKRRKSYYNYNYNDEYDIDNDENEYSSYAYSDSE